MVIAWAVSIENNVMIGAGAVILGDIYIGDTNNWCKMLLLP